MSQTAAAVEAQLRALQSDAELAKIQRFFKSGEGQYGAGDVFIGVRMGSIFDLAKGFLAMPLVEIEALLNSPIHEMRVAALSIMAKQATARKAPAELRQALYDLYLRRHDRINNWDLVDLAAHQVVGRWLVDKDRAPLYVLARSPVLWERRTAMLACWAFIRTGDLEDAYAIAEILQHDPEDLIHKVVGWMLRAAGDKDPARLRAFVEARADMPRVMLRAAIEKFPETERKRLLGR